MRPSVPVRVLLLCGSLRQRSLNAQLLQLVPSLVPPQVTCHFDAHLAQLPLYNEDLDTDAPPAAVVAFRAALAAADAIVVASPEYNHGVAAPLKNAIDWGSRPYGRPPMGGKVVVTFCATPGEGLGFEGLAQLHATMQAIGNCVVVNPRMVLQRAKQKLVQNEAGEVTLTDPVARALMVAQLGAMAEAVAAGAGPLARRGVELFNAARADAAR